MTQPTAYEAEYYYSGKEKRNAAFTGLVLLGVSSCLLLTRQEQWFVPLILIIVGLVLSYSGFKGWRDKKAKLKIAKSGLWTEKLGFVSWNDVKSAKVVKASYGRTTQLFLHIHLKGTSAEEPGQPDEELLLSDLEDKEMIETVVQQAITEYQIQQTQR